MKNISKYAEKGAMKHPGMVRNMLFSKVCNMVRESERERERERRREGEVTFKVRACLKY